MGALHHFERPGASHEGDVSGVEVKPPEEAEPDQAVDNEKDRYHKIEEPRHDQDQKTRQDGQYRRDMGDGKGH